jgi:hypothetical protein
MPPNFAEENNRLAFGRAAEHSWIVENGKAQRTEMVTGFEEGLNGLHDCLSRFTASRRLLLFHYACIAMAMQA